MYSPTIYCTCQRIVAAKYTRISYQVFNLELQIEFYSFHVFFLSVYLPVSSAYVTATYSPTSRSVYLSINIIQCTL